MVKPLYRGDYTARSKAVRLYAYANPATPCGMCGLTLAAHGMTKTGKRPTWDADHLRPGDPTSPLRPVVASCNRAAGGALGRARQAAAIGNSLRTSRQW